MKTKIILLACFLSIALFAYSQHDAIKKLNETVKKNGTSIEYLNANWKVVKDSTQAVYYRYVYYGNGTNTNPVGDYSRVNAKLEHKESKDAKKTKLTMLDGEYKWYDKDGHLLIYVYYLKGECMWLKDYTRMAADKIVTSNDIRLFCDMRNTYNDQPHTYRIEDYEKKGTMLVKYMRNDKDGWRAYAEPEGRE